MSDFCKKEAEMMDEDLPKLKTEDHVHGFKFQYIKNVVNVTCNEPMTLLESLEKNSYFQNIYKKNQGKELVIKRSEGPRGAVSLDLPCCLINKDEVLKMTFIKPEGVTMQTHKLSHSLLVKENLVTFYIRTRGGKNIRRIMKNNELSKTSDYVCVFAFKEEEVKMALKRDGRFHDVVFDMCALCDERSEIITLMSELVKLMDGKVFQVIKDINFKTESQESSQESETVKTESCNSGTSNSEEKHQESPNIHENKTTQKEKKFKSSKPKEIPDTKEILTLLQGQFKALLDTMKERENLKKRSGLQKVFKKEFSNSVHIFKKVKVLKDLMHLSNNVCQIRDDSGPCGTGFLLFDRFILTNAHVLKPDWSHNNTKAVFGFNDFDGMEKSIILKDLVVDSKMRNENENYLDFALLELELPELSDTTTWPELLSHCWDLPIDARGVCIIGHPGGEVKQIDLCLVVEKNENFVHIMTEQCLQYNDLNSTIFYNSCFYYGSSGSPVFDENCKLIGVHTGGFGNQEEVWKGSVEFALPIFNILVEIYKQCLLKNRFDVIKHFKYHKNLKPVVEAGNNILLNKK